ncbi:hypothetical protein NARC_30082 [Candidatus Nitrosocosmicus arcticus]|uniref:Uncharacterized protein n=1 Tax=Candidatus Nitrosocosmicus arcticus TaxID=2035267 RepID=A0A557SXN7_9ARCH|nr:hypothetical protein NARC_30082 [Candidatus Nitrosocosmicus arcticus]
MKKKLETDDDFGSYMSLPSKYEKPLSSFIHIKNIVATAHV